MKGFKYIFKAVTSSAFMIVLSVDLTKEPISCLHTPAPCYSGLYSEILVSCTNVFQMNASTEAMNFYSFSIVEMWNCSELEESPRSLWQAPR